MRVVLTLASVLAAVAFAQPAAAQQSSVMYNKPGATRAQYDSDWQECRLIARGSIMPAGMGPRRLQSGRSVSDRRGRNAAVEL